MILRRKQVFTGQSSCHDVKRLQYTTPENVLRSDCRLMLLSQHAFLSRPSESAVPQFTVMRIEPMQIRSEPAQEGDD
eukprot:5959951-Pleurochrysis_carterae.AAC.2